MLDLVFRRSFIIFSLLLLVGSFHSGLARGEVRELKAAGHESRVDLQWEAGRGEGVVGYNIYRARSGFGPFEKINKTVHKAPVYSDFLGENNRRYYYRVTVVDKDTLQISGTSSQHHTIDQLMNLILTCIDRDDATSSHQSTNNMKFSALTPFF